MCARTLLWLVSNSFSTRLLVLPLGNDSAVKISLLGNSLITSVCFFLTAQHKPICPINVSVHRRLNNSQSKDEKVGECDTRVNLLKKRREREVQNHEGYSSGDLSSLFF